MERKGSDSSWDFKFSILGKAWHCDSSKLRALPCTDARHTCCGSVHISNHNDGDWVWFERKRMNGSAYISSVLWWMQFLVTETEDRRECHSSTSDTPTNRTHVSKCLCQSGSRVTGQFKRWTSPSVWNSQHSTTTDMHECGTLYRPKKVFHLYWQPLLARH